MATSHRGSSGFGLVWGVFWWVVVVVLRGREGEGKHITESRSDWAKTLYLFRHFHFKHAGIVP